MTEVSGSVSENGWVAVDLDGTLAVYDHWRGHEHIGEPIPQMVWRVRRWIAAGRKVKIFTARMADGEEEVERHIRAWCLKHIGCELEVTNVKDYAMAEQWDDRAVAVERNTGHVFTNAAASKMREFHAAFGAHVQETPALPPERVRELRKRLLEEEFDEFVKAHAENDIVEIADALADMMYIIYGTALSYGIPLDAVFDEVHASNMSKLGPDGTPVVRDDGKILKGEGFFRPDLARVLASAA